MAVQSEIIPEAEEHAACMLAAVIAAFEQVVSAGNQTEAVSDIGCF